LAFPDSCIIRHFAHYCSLSLEEKKLLISLEKDPSDIAEGELLCKPGEAAGDFCTLSQGWAYSFRHLENGNRQILEVFLPGDIIGLRDFSLSRRMDGVQMVEDGVFCRFSYRHMLSLFGQSLTLTAVMFAISSHQQILLSERLVCLGRRSAREKIAQFVCEIHQRLSQTNPDMSLSFRIPLTQEQLGDILGLTPVHVSRTLSALNHDNLLFRNRHQIRIQDLEALRQEAGSDCCPVDDQMKPLFQEILDRKTR
jgi:CRP-like cAMP-binding protein